MGLSRFARSFVFAVVALIGFQTVAVHAKEPVKAKAAASEPLVMFMNYPYQVWHTDASKIHVVLFTPDFKPAAGAVVKVGDKVMGKADANGVCVFDFRPGANKARNLTAELKLHNKTYRTARTFRCNPRTVSFRSEQLFVYTDRGVYNPGQDVLIRLMAWQLKGEYSPIKDAEIEALFQNKKGKVFSGGKIKTNDYGIGAMKLPLPQNMPEGSYDLVVMYKKSREKASLRVKRFVPPVIHIKQDLPRFITDKQKRLAVKVELSYFAGGKLDKADVELNVVYGGKSILKHTPEPGNDHVILDESSLNKIRKAVRPETGFAIKLSATDSYGRKDTITRDMVYTRRPYRAVIQLDKDSYPAGEQVKVEAKVVDLDGKPAAGVKFTLTGPGKLTATSNAQGIATFLFKMPGNAVTVTLTHPDAAAPIAMRSVPITPKKPMVSKTSEPAKKAGAATKVSVSFDPAYVPIEKVIHVDLTDASGALVAATTIPIKQGTPATAEGVVTAKTWGTMLMNLYCCAVKKADAKKKLKPEIVGFVTEGQYVTLMPNTEVKIKIDGLKPRVRPGETLNLGIKTEGNGEVAIGAAVVDKAVISLLDPFEIKPQDRFYNPKLKVIASAGAGVLTWPVVDRNWGNPWRDIAYTNWGWKGAGKIHGGRGARGKAAANSIAGGAPAGQASKMLKKEAAPEDVNDDAPLTADDDDDAEEIAKDEMGDFAMGKVSGGKASVRRGANRARSRKPVKITIRKEFPETSLWEPFLVTKGGEAKLKVKVPEAITIQQLNLVASDKAGRLSLIRRDIEVRQDLFVQSGLPAVMALGDKVEVGALLRNLSGKPVKAKVSLRSDGLLVSPEEAREVEVAAGTSVPVVWEVTATKCGKISFAVTAKSDTFKDEEQKHVFVRPVGQPTLVERRGTLKAKRPWSVLVNVDAKALYKTTVCNVSFPNVFAALQGVEGMAGFPHGCVEQTSSQAMTNLVVLEYGLKTKMNPDKLDELRESLRYAAARIAAMQTSNGGWGWFALNQNQVGTKTNVYLTAYALRTLAEIRAADLPVSDKALHAGIKFLLATQKQGGWNGKDAFFWDVSNSRVDAALTCEIFTALTMAARSLPTKNYDGALSELAGFAENYLKKTPNDPMAVAQAVEALDLWNAGKENKDHDKLVATSLRYLVTLKRKGYWEPNWYHAYGGMVELNARILALLDKHNDRGQYEGLVRECMTWLLSTQEAWGAWHNTMGTAAAVRALVKRTSLKQEVASTVELLINGKVVKTVKIDPKDPFLSAISLRHVEITKYLRPGMNRVKLAYDGKLNPAVVIEHRQWTGQTVAARKSTAGLQISRKSPDKVKSGTVVPVELRLSSKKTIPFVLVEDSIPANMTIDERSLLELKKGGTIADYRLDADAGVVDFYLEKVSGEMSLSYRLTPARSGMAKHRGVTATGMYHPEHAASFVGKAVEVAE